MSKLQTVAFVITPEQRQRLNEARVRLTLERGAPPSLSELLREAIDTRFPPNATKVA